MHQPRQLTPEPATDTQSRNAISLAKELIRSYHLTDLHSTLEAAERLRTNQFLNVAIFGRFKAGKSSFLNNLLGRPVLPVGVVPVTSVVTEISYGPEDSACVIYQRGRDPEQVSIADIPTFVSESGNPGNLFGVERVCVSLPEMVPFKGLRLVDTPGLESNLTHNTEASLAWSPNTDLALVAVGVDPPLTQQDVALIKRLQRFTPNISLLLTKMDLLSPLEQQEILAFVTAQLRNTFSVEIPVFPYSVKPGFEDLRKRCVNHWLMEAVRSHQEARSGALARKLLSLLTSALGYLQLALKSAEATESDRERLRSKVLGPGQSISDLHLHIQFIAARAVARTRPLIERQLQEQAQFQIQRSLQDRLALALPTWRGSFAKTLSQFRIWLAKEMSRELAAASDRNLQAFLEPLREPQRLSQHVIQSFRDKLSDEVQRVFGVTLRTTEPELEIKLPHSPDVSIGKVLNHDWTLIFALIPMSLVRSLVERQFSERVESEVFKNLSRLTSQWEDILSAAIRTSEAEAHRRVDELVSTVRRLLSSSDAGQIEAIRGHLQQLQSELERLAAPKAPA